MPDAQMIGPYRLERVLGTGSFATVWLAYDDVLDRKVAVKILADNWSRDNDVRRRFLAEARVLLTVESPRIVRGFHLGETPTGQPYLVMAYADRGTLGDRIEQRRREGRTFDVRETVAIASEVAHALADVHGSGQLHRDVKPTNVLIRSSSTGRGIPGLAADEVVVLGDFGLARGLDLSSLTLVAGSPGYVAPEQAAGLAQLDRRADLYPLGRMMLEMLTGDPGGRATTMAGAAVEEIDVAGLLAGVASRDDSAASEQLGALITRLVAKDPDDRPSSAEEVAAALHHIGRGFAPEGDPRPLTPPSAPPVSGPPADGAVTGTQLAALPPRSRGVLGDRRVVAGASALLLVAVAAVVLALTRRGNGGSGEGTTTVAPVVVPDSTAPVVVATSDPATTAPVVVLSTDEATTSTGRGRPILTAPASVETTLPDTSAPASTVPDTSAPDTTAPASSTPSDPATLVLELPEGTYAGVPGTDPPDLSRQDGSVFLAADDFAAAVIELNPDWSGEAPAADDDGVVEFEMTGHGRVATIRIEPGAVTAGEGISRFEITYGRQ